MIPSLKTRKGSSRLSMECLRRHHRSQQWDRIQLLHTLKRDQEAIIIIKINLNRLPGVSLYLINKEALL